MSRYDIGKLTSILAYIANKDNDHDYIIYQRKTYGNVPLYAVLKVMTFGQLSAMYSLLTHKIQVAISQEFSSRYVAISSIDLMIYLRVLTHFRNRCAHIERLFSYTDRYDIPDTPIHKRMRITMKGKQYIYGKHDLFAVVIAYRYLLPKKDFKVFMRKLTMLIKKTGKQATTLAEQNFLRSMGFPANWKDITRYLV